MCPRFAIRKGVKVLSRLDIMTPSRAQTVIDGLYRDVERRIAASPPGLCPVDLAMNFLNLCHAQTCGKCVPCRVGLGQLSDLMESVLDGKATMETIALIERTARVIVNSADCAIGRDAARLVLDGIQGFRDDYEEHVLRHRCLGGMQNPVPCVALCPAGVDIPGYTVLVKYGRYADAVRLIRQDNPFPSACAYICEHPCEARCRRNMIDDAVNIRGLKRYAVDHAGYVPHPACAEETGKTVAIVGGGPSGLSAAYYLALMGHKVTVYEKRAKLGGMLRYGIPAYRLPREILDAEIASPSALMRRSMWTSETRLPSTSCAVNTTRSILHSAHTRIKRPASKARTPRASCPRSRCCARSATITCPISAARRSWSSAAATSRWMYAAAQCASARVR